VARPRRLLPFLMPIEMLIPCSAGQLGRKLREWNVYKYDSRHRPMDLDKPFSDDLIIERTHSVACHEANPRDPRSEYYSPAVPTTTTPLSIEYNNSSLDPDFWNNPYNILVASANHIAMSKEEQSSLDTKLSISPVLVDANEAYYSTGPITVTGPSVILSPSGNIPLEDSRQATMDTDMDRISITSLTLSSISGFASLRSLARRIRMTKASSEDRSMNDVPSSAMQWDTSSKNSLRLFGHFSMSSLVSVTSSHRTDTGQISRRPEALSTIEEDDGYTAEYQREGILPRLLSAFQYAFSVRTRGLDGEPYIPMIVRRVQDYGTHLRDLIRIGYGHLDPGLGVDAVSERFLEEPDYKDVRRANTGFTRFMFGETRLQLVGNISMRWHVMGKDDQVHITDFVIIPKDVPVSFDFVLGRSWYMARY
jgi:hypothetical protein